MRRMILSLALSAASVAAACGSNGDSSVFGGGGSGDGGGDDGGPGSDLFGFDGGPKGGCVGLQCKQHACANGSTTSVSGTVFDPAGKVPLYNVIVYVPNTPLAPMKQGASCDQCGSSVSGSPVVTTLTDAAGHFKLDNIPVADDLPLVIQIGKWRRIVTVPKVTDCSDVPVSPDLTRLPRNKSEGDIPQIALTTGACDPLECLLRKIGIDDAEFTAPGGTGRVHVFQGTSSADPQLGTGLLGGEVKGGSPPATSLWSNQASLMPYDMVLLACECDESADEKPQSALDALFQYTTAGGRVFGSHYHYYWFEHGPDPFPSTATWDHNLGVPAMITATIDDTFPKGMAFKQWLVNVGGSPAPGGSLDIGQARGDVVAANAKTSQRWIYLPSGPPSVQYFTFNTPLTVPDDQKCGRVVYSDLHVSGGTPPNNEKPDEAGKVFPNGCHAADLSPQEKALEFMLFDLSSCVISDNKPPTPPPVK